MLRPIPGGTEWKWQLSLSVSPFFHCLLPLLALSSSKDCGPPSSPCLTSQRDISFQVVAQLYLIFLSSKNLAHIPAFIVTNIHGENGEDKEEDKENGEQVGHSVERDLSSCSVFFFQGLWPTFSLSHLPKRDLFPGRGPTCSPFLLIFFQELGPHSCINCCQHSLQQYPKGMWSQNKWFLLPLISIILVCSLSIFMFGHKNQDYIICCFRVNDLFSFISILTKNYRKAHLDNYQMDDSYIYHEIFHQDTQACPPLHRGHTLHHNHNCTCNHLIK